MHQVAMSYANWASNNPKYDNTVRLLAVTDMYQVTMSYAYWASNKHNHPAVFELFFRKNPFNGEYVIFAGLSDVIAFMDHYK